MTDYLISARAWLENLFPGKPKTEYYCKKLIIRVTLFPRGHQPRFIHETLFSRFVIYSSIFLTLEIIGEDFIFASLCSREFTRK